MSKDDEIDGKAPSAGDEQSVGAEQQPNLSPAARRALAEAEERRRKAAADAAAKEVGGRDGPDPVRYGDWEKDGIISDF